MAKIEYDNKIFDSQEEVEFKHWLDEAYEAGLIDGFHKLEKGKDTIELIEKQYYYVDGKKKHCFASVDYTPDFMISYDELPLFAEKDMGEIYHYVDVKGGFSKYNDSKQFQIIRKMMFKIHGIYIHKVIPEKLFSKTWVPEKVRWTPKTGKLRKKYLNCKTIAEYLEGL